MSVKKYLKKITLQSYESNFQEVFLLSEYKNEGYLCLKVFIIGYSQAYAGRVEDFDLMVQATNIRVPKFEFIQKTTDALFENNNNSSSYFCTLEKFNEQLFFKWKFRDEEETEINIGSVPMEKGDSSAMLVEILQSSSDEMYSLNSKVEKMSVELSESKTDNSDALMQLSLAIDAKESLQQELYAKFILVLNAKKRRIQELQNKYEGKRQPQSKKTASHILSSDSSDVDGELDLDQPGPSKVRSRNSLMFLDESVSLVIPKSQNRIRNRNVPITKKPQALPEVVVNNSSSIKVPEDDGDESSEDLLKFI